MKISDPEILMYFFGFLALYQFSQLIGFYKAGFYLKTTTKRIWNLYKRVKLKTQFLTQPHHSKTQKQVIDINISKAHSMRHALR